MISNRCARKSLVTNCNSIISKNYLRFLVDSNVWAHEAIDAPQRETQMTICNKPLFIVLPYHVELSCMEVSWHYELLLSEPLTLSELPYSVHQPMKLLPSIDMFL